MIDVIRNFTMFNDCPSIQVGATRLLWLSPEHVISQESITKTLLDEELEVAETYRSKSRRFEYERARWLIRQALQYDGKLGRTEAGAPRWPEGAIGSLTHKEGFVGFTLQSAANFIGIGIDAEDPKRMQLGFSDRLLVKSEQSKLQLWSDSLNLTITEVMTVIFSFKEAIFKCIYPLGHKMFYFHDAEIIKIDSKGNLTARLLIDASLQTPNGFEIAGNYLHLTSQAAPMVLTNAFIPVSN